MATVELPSYPSLLDSLDTDEHWIDENVFIDQHHILTQLPHFLLMPNESFVNAPITFPPLSFMNLNKAESEEDSDYSDYDEDDYVESDSSLLESPDNSNEDSDTSSRSSSPFTLPPTTAELMSVPLDLNEEDEEYSSDFEPEQKKRKRVSPLKKVTAKKSKKLKELCQNNAKTLECPFKTCQLCVDRTSMQLETLKNQRWRGTAMALLYYYPDKDSDGYVQVNSPDVILYLQAHWNELAPYHQRDLPFDPEKVKKHVLDALSHNQDCFVNRRFDQGKKSRGYWKVRDEKFLETPLDFSAEVAQSPRVKGRKLKNKKQKHAKN